MVTYVANLCIALVSTLNTYKQKMSSTQISDTQAKINRGVSIECMCTCNLAFF